MPRKTIPVSKRKEIRTVIMLSLGLAIAMLTFAVAAKHFIAGPG
jgi:hypothetical protein